MLEAKSAFGSIVRKRLKELGKTQVWLCEVSGISRNTITDMISGRVKTNPDIVNKVVEILGISMDEVENAKREEFARLNMGSYKKGAWLTDSDIFEIAKADYEILMEDRMLDKNKECRKKKKGEGHGESRQAKRTKKRIEESC